MPTASPLRNLRIPAFVLAAVLLLSVGVAMVLGIRRLDESVVWLEHTYQVMQALETHQHTLRTAESASRGFRLTGQTSLEAEYLEALPEIERAANLVVRLTADNPAQQRRARALRTAGQKRLDEIDRLLDIQREQGAERAREETVISIGVRQMQEIETLAEEMQAHEASLLGERRATSAARVQRLTAVVAAGIAVPLLLLGVLVLGLVRENRRVHRLQRDAQGTLREMELLLAQRNRLSEQHRSLGAYAGLLQSSQSLDEAMAMTANVVTELMPEVGGRCYVLRASQNLAESTAQFGHDAVPGVDLLQPGQCWALRRGQPYRSDRHHNALRCTHYVDGAPRDVDAWTLCVPLMAQGASLGMLHVNGRGAHDDADLSIIEAIGEQLSLAMVNLQLRETLRVQSLRDPLTGLFNRRYLEESLTREIQRCQRRGMPLSVLMLDVDHFKQFNDAHGHAAGDALLARVGQTLQAMTRHEDIACRYGGEEFTIVLPEASAENAAKRAEDIRAAIATTTILHLRKTLGPATASIGVATFPRHGPTPARLMEAADSALYRAKAQGRDRVVTAD